MLDRPVPWLWVGLALLAYGAWHNWQRRELHHAPGVLVREEPLQQALGKAAPFAVGDFRVTPLANFRLRARVLSREDYRADPLAALIPTDLALGWGAMSDSSVLERIEISQDHRYYVWHVQQWPIPEREIVTHSANMHLIPADAGVARTLAGVRRGQIVRLAGQLVEAVRGDGLRIRSSLSRDDSGAGACEVIYVTELAVEPS